jgi:hypothetical protein
MDYAMNKTELISAIAASADQPKATAAAALDAFTASITGALQQGDGDPDCCCPVAGLQAGQGTERRPQLTGGCQLSS